MAAELRWILILLCVPLIAGIWWWSARRSKQAPGDAALREPKPREPSLREPTLSRHADLAPPPAPGEPQFDPDAPVDLEPRAVRTTPAAAAARAAERGPRIAALEPLDVKDFDPPSMHTDFGSVPVLDGPMLLNPETPAVRTAPPAEAAPPARPHAAPEPQGPAAAPARTSAHAGTAAPPPQRVAASGGSPAPAAPRVAAPAQPSRASVSAAAPPPRALAPQPTSVTPAPAHAPNATAAPTAGSPPAATPAPSPRPTAPSTDHAPARQAPAAPQAPPGSRSAPPLKTDAASRPPPAPGAARAPSPSQAPVAAAASAPSQRASAAAQPPTPAQQGPSAAHAPPPAQAYSSAHAAPPPQAPALSRPSPAPPQAPPTSRAAPAPRPKPADLQKIVSLRVSALGDTRWSGPQLRAALEMHGLAYGKYQIFHRRHSDGQSLYCVASLVEPGTFDLAAMESQEFRGITLFAVLPGPIDANAAVDDMLATANGLAQALSGTLQDTKGLQLSPQRAAALREEVADFQAALTGNADHG